MIIRDQLAAAVRHPMQPAFIDECGALRFKRNAIVDHLAEGKVNDLPRMNFSREDWVQFYQLIGYSVGGAPIGTLEKAVARAVHKDGLTPDQARIFALETELAELRKAARAAVEQLNELLPEEQ